VTRQSTGSSSRGGGPRRGWATVSAMTKTTQLLGAYGEELAAAHLVKAGMVVLDRNWRCSYGEIDIIARDGEVVVFCEVKTRRSTTFGTPAEAIVAAKAHRLRKLAGVWLSISTTRPREIRFDVVSVLPGHAGTPQIEHIKAAF
jgi:putative endonuclease